MIDLTALLAAALVLVHLLVGRLRFLDVVPRSRWLSAAGGVAVAYVFLHILPELSRHRQTFAAGLGVDGQAAESWVYLVALAGLVTFYGLERAAKISGGRRHGRGGGDPTEAAIFQIHIGSFGLYNVIIGYLLLHREEPGLWPLLVYAVAMGLHFVTSDFGLRQHHQERYDRRGRWIVAAAVMVGWGLGVAAALPDLVIGFLLAFLAGGIVLNVLKEELPEERQSRFWPFAGGMAGYAALLLAV